MPKKGKAEREGAAGAADGSSLSQSVLKSSQQIWLAGLGAFAKAQTGGVKVFETLVKQGASLEAKTRQAAAATADAAREAAAAKAKEMHAMAGGTWDKLEQVFQERVARALGQLGVYTSADVERLTARVNDLSEAVNALLKAQGGKRPAAAVAVKKVVKGAAKPAQRTGRKQASGVTKSARHAAVAPTKGVKSASR
jgi:poly(hydroxyalkanoate) granule-associated protein